MPPSPPPANAPCRCCISVCIMAGSMFMPDSRESCSASNSPSAAAQQLPEQLLELFLGTAILVCHFSRLSDRSARRVLR